MWRNCYFVGFVAGNKIKMLTFACAFLDAACASHRYDVCAMRYVHVWMYDVWMYGCIMNENKQ